MFIVEVTGPCRGCLQAGGTCQHTPRQNKNSNQVHQYFTPLLSRASHKNKECLLLFTLGNPDSACCSRICRPAPISLSLLFYKELPRAFLGSSTALAKVDIKWVFRKPSYLGIIHPFSLHKTSSALKGAVGIQYSFLIMTSSDIYFHTSIAAKI